MYICTCRCKEGVRERHDIYIYIYIYVCVCVCVQPTICNRYYARHIRRIVIVYYIIYSSYFMLYAA